MYSFYLRDPLHCFFKKKITFVAYNKQFLSYEVCNVHFQVQVGNLYGLKYCSFLNSHKNLRIGKHLSQRKQTLKKQFFIGFVDRTLDGVSFYAKKKKKERREAAAQVSHLSLQKSILCFCTSKHKIFPRSK